MCDCGKDPIVFPFQFDIGVICRRCNVFFVRVVLNEQAVFHKECYKGMEHCSKCKRIRERHLKEKEEMGDFSEQLVDEERHQPMIKTLDM